MSRKNIGDQPATSRKAMFTSSFFMLGAVAFLAWVVFFLSPKIGIERHPFDPNLYKHIVTNAFPQAIVKAGHSYIPLGVEGYPSDYAEKILQLIVNFESSHRIKVSRSPTFEVFESPFNRPQIRGMWLVHN